MSKNNFYKRFFCHTNLLLTIYEKVYQINKLGTHNKIELGPDEDSTKEMKLWKMFIPNIEQISTSRYQDFKQVWTALTLYQSVYTKF